MMKIMIKSVTFMSSSLMMSQQQQQLSMKHTWVAGNRKWCVARVEQNQKLGQEDLQTDMTAASHKKPDTQAEIIRQLIIDTFRSLNNNNNNNNQISYQFFC